METTENIKSKTRELESDENAMPVVDEELSHSPFFQIYTYPEESSITTSLNRSIAMTQEVLIAKLFATDIMGNPKLLVFTNHGFIVLSLNTGLRRAFWQIVGLVEKIPVIGWILSLLTEPLQAFTSKILKTDYKQAKRLTSLSHVTILETRNSKKKVTKLGKSIYGSWKLYAERLREFQPSVGVSIQHKKFSYVLTKISVTTLRVLPLWRWFEVASSIGGAAEYTLPSREVIPKIRYLIQSLPDNVSVEYINAGQRDLRFHWPEEVGVGTKRWSMYAAAILTSILFCIFGILVIIGISGEEEAYWLALLAGLGAIQSFIMGRSFGYAILFGLLPTLALIITTADEMGLFR